VKEKQQIGYMPQYGAHSGWMWGCLY